MIFGTCVRLPGVTESLACVRLYPARVLVENVNEVATQKTCDLIKTAQAVQTCALTCETNTCYYVMKKMQHTLARKLHLLYSI